MANAVSQLAASRYSIAALLGHPVKERKFWRISSLAVEDIGVTIRWFSWKTSITNHRSIVNVGRNRKEEKKVLIPSRRLAVPHLSRFSSESEPARKMSHSRTPLDQFEPIRDEVRLWKKVVLMLMKISNRKEIIEYWWFFDGLTSVMSLDLWLVHRFSMVDSYW